MSSPVPHALRRSRRAVHTSVCVSNGGGGMNGNGNGMNGNGGGMNGGNGGGAMSGTGDVDMNGGDGDTDDDVDMNDDVDMDGNDHMSGNHNMNGDNGGSTANGGASTVNGLLRKCLKTFKHPRVEVDGFLYHFHKKCNRHLRWKCNRVFSMRCPSILRTTRDVDDLRLVALDHDHIHSNDSHTILQVKKRLANQKEKSRVDPTKQSTMVTLKETGVFNQRNGKRLYPYNTENKIHEYSENPRFSVSNGIECSNIEELTHLNSRNINKNQNDQNKIETNSHANYNSNKTNFGEVIEQNNMYYSTSHDHIEASQINTTIFETNNHNVQRNMNQVTLNSECSYIENMSNKDNEGSLIEISDDDDYYEPGSNDVHFESDENWSNKKKKTNPLIDIEDENQLEVTHPFPNNVPASIDLTQDSLTSQNIGSVLQKQRTPYTCTSNAEKVKNKNSLPDVVHYNYNYIDLTDDNEVCGRRIRNIFTLEPVPAAIPISDCVQNNLQEVEETRKIVYMNGTRNLTPIPKLKAFILPNWFYKISSANVELTLYFDKHVQKNTIRGCELYCYQVSRNASSSTWEYAGEIVPEGFPVMLSLRLENIGKKDIFFSARAADIFGKFGKFCEPVQCTYKHHRSFL